MNLLSLNLQRASAINCAIYGNFSGPKCQEIVAAKGTTLDLLRPDETGKLIIISSTPVFSLIRSLLAFRLAGATRDYLVIGSDSGKISILEFDTSNNTWKVVHCEVFGKTGCRRIVPGQYLAADPKGRALLIASIEKQKFVYVMNRDSANRLTISSPLEAHKSETIVFSTCGVDVGFDNPIFAMIELDYSNADQDPTGEAALETDKKLTYYELDLGLNHVVRKWSEPISRTANFLLTVPGGDDGPSGVLICGENWIGYKHQGHPEVRTALPRRHDLPIERGVLITSGTVHKQKDMFFFLIQSEYGDLYKVTLETSKTNPKLVTNIIATVFDSIQPSTSLCITKTGLLFAASEFGNHSLFQFQGIGDDPDAIRSEKIEDEELGDDSQSASSVAPLFRASDRLSNLCMTDDISSLCPITDMLVEDLTGAGEAPQIHLLCGRGHRSSLRVLKHGVSVGEMAVSPLPANPTGIWTVKTHHGGDFDQYIVVSFDTHTMVLSVGDNVQEVTDSGFDLAIPTLHVMLLEDNALIQVHANGMKHIRIGSTSAEKKVTNWRTDGRQVRMATANARQVAIACSGGYVYYFELNMAGTLVETKLIDLGKDISSIDIGDIPEGRIRSSFLAVGFIDATMQILSLDPSDLLAQRAFTSLPSQPDSLSLIQLVREKSTTSSVASSAASSSSASSSSSTSTTSAAGAVTSLYLNVGLQNGTLFRFAVDLVTGSLSDSRMKFLGPKSIRLIRIPLETRQPSLLALSSTSWLCYMHQGRYVQSPLSYQALEYASSFSSEACPNAIVAVSGRSLRILTVDNLGESFNQTVHPLRYTPRKMVKAPATPGSPPGTGGDLIIIETDHNEFSEATRAVVAERCVQSANEKGVPEPLSARLAAEKAAKLAAKAARGGMEGEEEEEEEEEEGEEGTFVPIRGPVPPTEGVWGSCIRIIDPTTGISKEILELENNEAALSICVCRFIQHSEEPFVIVGTSKNLTLHPRNCAGNFLNVYRIVEGRLTLVHQTELDPNEPPLAICEFQGRLLVGAGRTLKIFSWGIKKLLKKCENRSFPSGIVRLQVMGNRIYVGDLSESIHLVKFKRQENLLLIFADDTSPRFTSTLTVLDYDTVAATDKFGNFFTLRLPEGTTEEVVDNLTAGAGATSAGVGGGVVGSRILWDQGLLNGAPCKLQNLNHFYLGETVTAMSKVSLLPGTPEILICATINGSLYAIVPFISKEDVTFFKHLEMFLRQESPNYVQRDHLSFRSFYQPVKNVIDGDLCERFLTLPFAKQKEFADDVGKTIQDVIKKLEETRSCL